jgi:1-acyl-sn-glycerol-3-phosphate acyltransferase
MPDSATAAPAEDVEARVLAVVRDLVEETGGQRALRALAGDASLERDLGLGSLERAELLVRLEAAFGRTLSDDALEVDTPQGLARMLGDTAARPEHETRHARDAQVAARAAAVDAATISESLWRHAQADPHRPHVYLRDGDGPAEVVTYGRLFAEAAAVAGGLRDEGIRPGDTVALMLPTGFDFLRAFQGILLAGAVPVPIYPPVRLDRLDEYAERQSAILANAEVRVLITIDRARGVAGILKPAVPTLRRVTTAGDLAGRGAAVATPESKGTDAAFIQYTSGSTGNPKGVLLTHANLLANIRAIGSGIDVQPTDVGVSWLPLYHDMGLIGTWLFCMHQGLPVDIQSPLAFLSRPERWLWAIHERRGTLSPAPNFAYELCVRRISDQAIEGLDLSSWRVALNGAEPVSPDTLERFAQRFEPYGFRREAMMPVYGLAENSVALAFPPVGRGPRVTRVRREPFERDGRIETADEPGALPFVSAGAALPGNEIRLVDDRGQDVGADRVGRLQFRGASATSGYYRQPEATAAMTSEGGWLDSGDLAFRHDGELHIAGRSKDLIIKGGRNLVPQEIEEVVGNVPGVRRGCVVAFGAPHETLGTERLVVVAETRNTDATRRDALAAEVTARVADAIGVPPDAVELVRPGDVPKTSSGKIQRQATRALYLQGALGAAPRTAWTSRARIVTAAGWAEARPRVLTAVRALYGAYLAGVVAALFAVLWPPAMLLPRRIAARIGRVAARILTTLAGARLTIEGLERLPADGAFVIASNHASYVDVPSLMAAIPRDVRFVAKKEILGWPLVGAFVRKTQHLTVDRADAQQSVAEADRVGAVLRDGDPVAFFPEGTFTDAAGLRPFRLGAFKTAAEHGVPVVPVALVGTRRWLRTPWAPRPGRIAVWIGEPVRAEGTGWRDVVALRDRVADAIAAHCGEPRLDLVASGLVRP